MDMEKIQVLRDTAAAFAVAAKDLAEATALLFQGGLGSSHEINTEIRTLAFAVGRFRQAIEDDVAGTEIDPEAKSLLEDALTTDGAHHKQWFLEQLYERLGGNLEELRAAADGLERGIAP